MCTLWILGEGNSERGKQVQRPCGRGVHGVFEEEDRSLGGWGRVNEWEPHRVGGPQRATPALWGPLPLNLGWTCDLLSPKAATVVTLCQFQTQA